MKRRLALGAISAVCLSAALLVPSAALGASTVFCKVNEEKCAEKNIYPGTVKTLTGGLGTGFPGSFMELTLTKVVVRCLEGKLGPMEMEETTGPLVGKMVWWFSLNCEPSGCEVEVLESGYAVELEVTSKGNGRLLATVPSLKASCLVPALSCTFSSTPIEFTVEGGNPAHIVSEAKLGFVGGTGGCGAPAKLKSRYAAAGGLPLFVSHR